MKLKLTTLRALQFEKRTGKDIVKVLKKISDTGEVSVVEIVELFSALGDDYTPEKFDEWEASFTEKAEAIIQAVAVYLNGSQPVGNETKK